MNKFRSLAFLAAVLLIVTALQTTTYAQGTPTTAWGELEPITAENAHRVTFLDQLGTQYPGDLVLDIAFSPNGSLLASARSYGSDYPTGGITLWDMNTGTRQDHPRMPTAVPWHVSFSPDGNSIAYAGGTWARFSYPLVTVWDTETGEERVLIEADEGTYNFITFSPQGTYLAFVQNDPDERITLWDLNSNSEVASWAGRYPVFSPNGDYFAFFQYRQRSIHLWDMRQLVETTSFVGFSPMFSPDSALLAYIDRTGQVHLLDLENSEEILIPNGERPIGDLRFSPDGTLLAATIDENTVVWSTQNGTQIATFEDLGIFNPDWSVFVSTVAFRDYSNARIILQDAQTGEELASLDGRDWLPMREIEFSPDGRIMVSVIAETNVILLWGVPAEGDS